MDWGEVGVLYTPVCCWCVTPMWDVWGLRAGLVSFDERQLWWWEDFLQQVKVRGCEFQFLLDRSVRPFDRSTVRLFDRRRLAEPSLREPIKTSPSHLPFIRRYQVMSAQTPFVNVSATTLITSVKIARHVSLLWAFCSTKKKHGFRGISD